MTQHPSQLPSPPQQHQELSSLPKPRPKAAATTAVVSESSAPQLTKAAATHHSHSRTSPNNSSSSAASSSSTPVTPTAAGGGAAAANSNSTPIYDLPPEETTDLEELEQFAKTFKQRRIKLGKIFCLFDLI